jgi:signal transduction histidine kinase
MDAPWSQLIYTIAVGLGCLVIRFINRLAGPRVAHICFMVVILGLFIPSWLNGGGTLHSTRFFSVIFFSLHLVLFPAFRLVYLVAIWMSFTLISLGIEYLYPDWVNGRLIDTPTPLPMLLEQGVVHFIVFVTCGLLLRHTINAFLRAESRLHDINRTQRDLLRITSHDLRGPVNNLQLGIEALITTVISQEEAIDQRTSDQLHTPQVSHDPTHQLIKQLAPTLKLQVQHMDFLMRNLSYFRLNHNEKLSPFLESTSGYELISQVVEGWRLRADRGALALKLIIPDAKLLVVTDRMFLKQILDNLISNALKYSPTQSEVSVLVRSQSADLIIEVCDQGSGIPPEDQTRIFACFERAGNPDRPREHSIGLGLWIVSLLAPLIHAKINITGSSDAGSVFRLTLQDALISH